MLWESKEQGKLGNAERCHSLSFVAYNVFSRIPGVAVYVGTVNITAEGAEKVTVGELYNPRRADPFSTAYQNSVRRPKLQNAVVRVLAVSGQLCFLSPSIKPKQQAHNWVITLMSVLLRI